MGLALAVGIQILAAAPSFSDPAPYKHGASLDQDMDFSTLESIQRSLGGPELGWQQLNEFDQFNKLCNRLQALAIEAHPGEQVYIHPVCITSVTQDKQICDGATTHSRFLKARVRRDDNTTIHTRIGIFAHITDKWNTNWTSLEEISWHCWAVAIVQGVARSGKALIFYDDQSKLGERDPIQAKPREALWYAQEKFFDSVRRNSKVGKIGSVWLVTKDMGDPGVWRCMPNTFQWVIDVLRQQDGPFVATDPKWGGLVRLQRLDQYC